MAAPAAAGLAAPAPLPSAHHRPRPYLVLPRGRVLIRNHQRLRSPERHFPDGVMGHGCGSLPGLGGAGLANLRWIVRTALASQNLSTSKSTLIKKSRVGTTLTSTSKFNHSSTSSRICHTKSEWEGASAVKSSGAAGGCVRWQRSYVDRLRHFPACCRTRAFHPRH